MSSGSPRIASARALGAACVRYGPDSGLEKLRRFLDQISQRRAGGEDDVKGVAVFLASDAAAYVTGQVLVVDGGWLVRG